jgi:hypothetical protein
VKQKKNKKFLIFTKKNLSNNRKKIHPPLGLYPQKLFFEDRLNDINAAIIRYIDADYLIPKEWIDEREWIIKKLEYGKFKKHNSEVEKK